MKANKFATGLNGTVKPDPATGKRSYSNNVPLPIKLTVRAQIKG